MIVGGFDAWLWPYKLKVNRNKDWTLIVDWLNWLNAADDEWEFCKTMHNLAMKVLAPSGFYLAQVS